DLVPAVVGAETANAGAVIGVVVSRMALVPQGGNKTGADAYGLESVTGLAGPGDFVAVVVQGVTMARVDPVEVVEPGQRLVAAEERGHVRALRTVTVEGVELSEAAGVVGIALAAPDDDGRVPVYVRAR